MAMRRAAVALRQQAAKFAKDQTASFASKAVQEATRSITKPATATIIAALGGAAVLNYGFSAHQTARAEAQVPSPSNTPSNSAPEDRYIIPTDHHGLPKEITLYQYEVCPFCNKVRAFLDYHNLPYRVVEVNPLTKAELKWSDYKKVPVVVLDDTQQYNDSSAIISQLEAELLATNSQPPSASKKRWFNRTQSKSDLQREEEIKWRKWVDDWYVRVLTVNIYRNAKESFQTFDYITEHGNFAWWEREAARVFGATLMWGLSGKLKKKYGVDGDVRAVLFEATEEWVQAVGDKNYLGGDKPNLADLAVFGVLRSVTGTDTFNDVMHQTKIGGWYERMMNAVGESARIK